jgi:hypothetical protein
MRSVPQSVRSVQFADMSAGALDRSYWLNEDDRFRWRKMLGPKIKNVGPF